MAAVQDRRVKHAVKKQPGYLAWCRLLDTKVVGPLELEQVRSPIIQPQSDCSSSRRRHPVDVR